MKEEKKSNQQIYRVRVYRDFDYPSFSIDRNKTLEDVSYKSIEEIRESRKEEGYFNFEIINVLPFSLNVEPDKIINNSDFDFLIKEIALQDVREKYGDLDFEKNPNIFMETEKNDLSVTYRLKLDVENYYIRKSTKYYDIMRNKIVRR